MRTIWIVSDTHFGHKNLLTFTAEDGVTLVRPGFASVEEMDETMVERWNERVHPEDKVYHLGDVAMSAKRLPIMERLNGAKTLILGNHDIFDTKLYLKWFKNVRAFRVLDGTIFSHIPIHPASLGRFGANVHGHIHERVLPDPRYRNVSVEQTNYAPVELSELLDWANKIKAEQVL